MNSELQKTFDQAVQAQSEGKNQEALALYDSIKSQGVTSYATDLNQALLYESFGEFGKALQDIDHAQRIARRPWLADDIERRIIKKVPGNRASAIGSFGEILSVGEKVIRPQESLFLGSVLIVFFFLIRALGFKNKPAWSLVGLGAVFILFSVFCSLANRPAYLLTDANLHSVPVPASPTKFSLVKGTKVSVLRENNKYIEVERPGDFHGWVEKSAVQTN